ncbi:MAG TPA: type II toxin-antitoxin system RatA family toxin [Steroidobacteraceae bacterium]|nr:type II toxin-antitoxin system RatA family toxin [Steroidobacteraceae bacterium]
MHTVERSALVPYTAEQMFTLVNDVVRYPEFLPWCVGARVEPEGTDAMLATLKIARGMLRTEFKTRNTGEPGRKIIMQLVEGPFRHLRGEWAFEPIAERGSSVRFRVEFEFKNRWMAAALNPVFDSVCRTTVDAFVLRAQRIYGPERA